jgi:DNA-binding transcriptional ArsR family regulator
VVTYESVLDALGDRTRRQIVQVLRAGPAAVGELAERLPVSRPAISQHLKVLQACQLVAYEPVGTRHLYRLDPAGVRELRAWLDDFWDGALGQFARFAAEQYSPGGTTPRTPRCAPDGSAIVSGAPSPAGPKKPASAADTAADSEG